MDHADAREALELAAVEPGGLDRLVAGDTPSAAAVAGHLAGCSACTAYLEALRRDARIVASVVRTLPPPELRERTLAGVAAMGRTRMPASVGAPAIVGDGPAAGAEPPIAPSPSAGRGARRRPLPLIAAMAAALVVAVGATAIVVSSQRDAGIAQRDAELQRQAGAIAGLNRVAMWSLRISGEEDARRVPLTGASEDVDGSILFSPSSRELAILVEGLTPPPEGKEFRCWLEAEGRRRAEGRMFFGGELAFWAGPVEGDGLDAASGFGVSLVDAGGTSLDGDPVLWSADD